MHTSKKMMLAAGLLAGAAAMTGCTASTTPVTTPTPQAQQATAQPATARPAADASPQAAMDQSTETGSEDTPVPIALLVDGKEVSVGAAQEKGDLLLPLEETAEALGWKSDSQQTQEDTQTRRVITLDKDDSRITVSWLVSDNTAKQIIWQKDGLLIPVDTRITTLDGVVYVPAAFFEEAMEVSVSRTQKGVSVETPKPKDTPETGEQEPDGNGQKTVDRENGD